MANRKESHISQARAAEIAGVHRVAITKLRKTRSFFTESGKVDTNHPDWISYLHTRNQSKVREEIKASKHKEEDFEFRNFVPSTIQEEKIYADIQQRKLAIMQELDVLVEKKLVSSAFGEISKNVQSNFVDLGRRIAPRISAKIGLPGTEKIIEKEINEEVKKAIQKTISAVIKAIEKL